MSNFSKVIFEYIRLFIRHHLINSLIIVFSFSVAGLVYVVLNDSFVLSADEAIEDMDWTLIADYCADIDNVPSDEALRDLNSKISSHEDFCWFYISNMTEDGRQIIGLSDETIDGAVSKYSPDYDLNSKDTNSGLRLTSGKTIKKADSSTGFWIYGVGSHDPVILDNKEIYPIGIVDGASVDLPGDTVIVNTGDFNLFETGTLSVHCIFKKQIDQADEEAFSKYMKENLGGYNCRVVAPYAFRIQDTKEGVSYTLVLAAFIIILALVGCIAIFFYGTVDFRKHLKICYDCGMTKAGCHIAYLLLFLIYMAVGILIQLPIGYLIIK